MVDLPEFQKPMLLNQLAKTTAEVDGVQVVYDSDTVFLVQIGKDKGAYHTRFSSIGDLAQIVALYRGLNIGNHYKKRLVQVAVPRNILIARSYS